MKNQEILKSEYLEELKKVWKDEKMQKWCLNESNYLIKTKEGKLISISKPRIEKSFCFGYSDIGQGDEYDVAQDKAANARKSVEYFMERNLRDLNGEIKAINNYLAENKDGINFWEVPCAFYVLPHYNESNIGSLKAYYHICDEESDLRWYENRGLQKPIKADADTLNQYLEGLKEVKAQFIKRLNTYLKKYGLSKLHVWTYWVDE